MQTLFMLALLVTSVFLILLVLVQRGRGGGLTGALGGMGGQSAFGSKAGDLFTRITIVVASVWILLCVGAIWALNTPENVFGTDTESVFGTDAGLSSDPTEKDTSEDVAPGTSGTASPSGLSAEPAVSSEGTASPAGDGGEVASESEVNELTNPAPAETPAEKNE